MKQMIVLGTGQAVCLQYCNTAFALYDGTQYFLVDGGGGHEIMTCFYKTQISWQKLHHAFLSHAHTDDLLGMVWVVRYVAELINWGRYDGNLVIYGNDVALGKLLQVCELLLKPTQKELIGTRIISRVVEDGQSVLILNNKFTFFDINARKTKQFGFRLDTPAGIRLVFLGDEPFKESSASQMESCDWLITEAFCLYRERAIYNPEELQHSTVKEASECAERFSVKNLVMLHTEDETTYGRKKKLYTEEAKQFFSGRIYVPYDFETIDLS